MRYQLLHALQTGGRQIINMPIPPTFSVSTAASRSALFNGILYRYLRLDPPAQATGECQGERQCIARGPSDVAV